MRRGVATVVAALVGTLVAAAARADPPPSDEEVNARLEFLKARLKKEGAQAHQWEAGWSIVFTGGFGYATYELGRASNRAQVADGIVGMSKSLAGTFRLILAPKNSSLGAHPLDDMPMNTPEERLKQLLRAEALLKRNVSEARYRRSWVPHVVSALVNLGGGAVIWACGDLYKGLESAAIGLAAGELNIWTQPWKASRDEREYRKEFGAYVSPAGPPRSPSRVTVSGSANGVAVSF